MQHEVASMNTKKMIAASLKGFMEKKPLSKITVSEIVEDCNINRKTFYYHFEDIRSLIKWILEEEAVNVIKQYDLIFDYEDAIEFVIDYATQNKYILRCAYDSMGRDELRNFFRSSFYAILRSIIPKAEEILEIRVSDSFNEFICDFYTEALSGKLIDLFRSGKPFDKEALLKYSSIMLGDSMAAALKAAAQLE